MRILNTRSDVLHRGHPSIPGRGLCQYVRDYVGRKHFKLIDVEEINPDSALCAGCFGRGPSVELPAWGAPGDDEEDAGSCSQADTGSDSSSSAAS